MEYIGRSNLMTTVDREAEHSGYQMKVICIDPNCKKELKNCKKKLYLFSDQVLEMH